MSQSMAAVRGALTHRKPMSTGNWKSRILTAHFKQPFGTKIFWGLSPFELQYCQVSLQLEHEVYVFSYCPSLNMSKDFRLFCILVCTTLLMQDDFQQHLFHDAYVAKVLQTYTIFSRVPFSRAHIFHLRSDTCHIIECWSSIPPLIRPCGLVVFVELASCSPMLRGHD